MEVDLLTARLRLRGFVPGDVERLLELDSDPAVMRYLTGGRATSRAELERDYLPAFLAPAASFGAQAASSGAASSGAASSGAASSGAASIGVASVGVSCGGYGFVAAELRSSGQFIGWFHLRPRPADPPDEPELGYRLRRAMWGHGFATEGARALVDRAFFDGGARRVYAHTMAVNAASRAVMHKIGMTLVRTFHQQWPDDIEGSEHGDVEYALTRQEWLASSAGPG